MTGSDRDAAPSAVQELGANRPLALAGAERSWVAVRGVIEIFAAGTEFEATPRIHVATAVAGDTLFGLDESRIGNVRLIAVGGNASAVRMERVSSEDDRRRRREWLTGLALALDDDARARPEDARTPDSPTGGRVDELLADAVVRRRALSGSHDVARVAAQRGEHEGAMADGLETLRALVRAESADATPPLAGRDPLAAAFRIVAKAQGVTVPSLPPGAPGADPVANMARAARVRTRRVSMAEDWWRQDSSPMLGYLIDGHRPIALLPVRSGRYRLIDPATGTRTIVDATTSTQIEPGALVIYRPLPDGPLTPGQFVRSALVLSRADIVRLLLYAFAGAVMALAVPLVTGQIVGSVIPESNVSELVQLILALLLATIAGALFQVTTVVAVLRIQGRVDAYLVPALWGRLLSLPTSFFRRYTAGSLAYRVQSAGAIVKLVSAASVTALIGGVFSLVSLALIWFYSVAFGVIATALIAVLITVVLVSTRVQMRRMNAVEAVSGRLTGMLLELVTGVSKLRVAGAQEKAFQLYATRFAAKKRGWNAIRRAQHVVGVIGAVFPFASALALFAAVGFSETPTVSPGDFLAINAAYGQVVVAVLAMSAALTQFVYAVPGLQRALPILVEPPEDEASKADPGLLRGAVEYSSVSFRYQEDGPLVLDDVSIHVPAGSSVALVGPSGSGKSTLGRLLLGFEQPDEGAIFYDNQDLAGLDVRAVRRQLGVVLQSVQLLPGTILTNIVGDAIDLTSDDAWRAAEQAGLAQDIRAMPMGMHTAISEGSSTLSGGQKQRLLIARALAGDPRILLFDEATSALDNATQSIVSESLESMSATRIVIAHRLSTVVSADCIYYLEGGRVLEAGSFDELMALGGRFAAQARRQLT